jgi:hypothetical protein
MAPVQIEIMPPDQAERELIFAKLLGVEVRGRKRE